LTGGEPLVRRNVMSLVRSLSRHLDTGALNELTLTTNGSQLRVSPASCGTAGYGASTSRWIPSTPPNSAPSPAGRSRQGFGRHRGRARGRSCRQINAVSLKNLNEEEIPSLMEWAHGKGMALTLIESCRWATSAQGASISMCRCPASRASRQTIYLDRPRR